MYEEKRNSNRKFKIQEVLREIIANFINGENNKTSLITVTRVDVSPNLSTCDVYVTVFPETAEESALNFLKRKRPDVKLAIKKRMSIRKIPFVDFKLDVGEKNRQRIQDISSHLD